MRKKSLTSIPKKLLSVSSLGRQRDRPSEKRSEKLFYRGRFGARLKSLITGRPVARPR